ncbi:apoptosis inducing factor BLCAP-like [Convolutriloba macropyga]|uniref:apoptosis inducing factor BLCAP-like n=1 Tax=Convolutriloba macropyga TaxID=536237 RepID=UPI003F52345E
MYCLQWLLPVLLVPKPLLPALHFNHALFMALYLIAFFLERKPCTICAAVFIVMLILMCQNCSYNCAFVTCTSPEAASETTTS